MLKQYEILSRVLYLYYNVVNHNQAETIRDDWTDRKQAYHKTTICSTKQASVDSCCRRCSNANPGNKTSP